MLSGRGLVNVEAFLLDLSPIRAVAGKKVCDAPWQLRYRA